MVDSVPTKFEWGWETDDSFTPVITEFKGVMGEIETLERPPNPLYPNSKAQMQLKYNFTDIEVIESKEPFEFPIFSFPVTYTPKMTASAFGAMVDSLSEIVPPEGRSNPRFVEGLRCHMKWSETLLRSQQNNVWGDYPGFAWKFVGIEGYTADEGPTLNERVLDMLVGKTKISFQEAYYAEPDFQTMSGYNEMTERLATGDLFDEFENAGLIKRDDEGVFAKV